MCTARAALGTMFVVLAGGCGPAVDDCRTDVDCRAGEVCLVGACVRTTVSPASATTTATATATATAALATVPTERMVLVPAGKYPYGSDPKKDKGRYPGEEATDRPRSLGAFYIDVYEYPNHEGKMPRAAATWEEAGMACRALGKRLCSEAEWEAACEGASGAVYGYGDDYDPARCHTAKDETAGPAPSGAYAGCVSPFGVYDMPGNLAEWTNGVWKGDPALVVARSGAFSSKPRVLRCANRIPNPLEFTNGKYGFRCCADGPRSPEPRRSLAEAVASAVPLETFPVPVVTAGGTKGRAGGGEPAGYERCLVDHHGLLWTWCGELIPPPDGEIEATMHIYDADGRPAIASSEARYVFSKAESVFAGVALAIAHTPTCCSDEAPRLIVLEKDVPVRATAVLEVDTAFGDFYVGAQARLSESLQAVEMVSSYSVAKACTRRLVVFDGHSIGLLGETSHEHDLYADDEAEECPETVVIRTPVLGLKGVGRWRLDRGRLVPD